MSCRGYGPHRSHLPPPLIPPPSLVAPVVSSASLASAHPLDHGGGGGGGGIRCCCLKDTDLLAPREASLGAERQRATLAPHYCRCGVARPLSLDHLFLSEDLSIVPTHLKYCKAKFRGVRIDGRMYFLPNSQHFGRIWVGEGGSDRDESRSHDSAIVIGGGGGGGGGGLVSSRSRDAVATASSTMGTAATVCIDQSNEAGSGSVAVARSRGMGGGGGSSRGEHATSRDRTGGGGGRTSSAAGQTCSDDWRAERRRSSGRCDDLPHGRRPRQSNSSVLSPLPPTGSAGSRSSSNGWGSFVLTVNTGSRYQPAGGVSGRLDRRFTVPRLEGGVAFSSSSSAAGTSAAAAAAAAANVLSSSTSSSRSTSRGCSSSAARRTGGGGSARSSTGAADAESYHRESSSDRRRYGEKSRTRRSRVVKFADDEQNSTGLTDDSDTTATSRKRDSRKSASRREKGEGSDGGASSDASSSGPGDIATSDEGTAATQAQRANGLESVTNEMVAELAGEVVRKCEVDTERACTPQVPERGDVPPTGTTAIREPLSSDDRAAECVGKNYPLICFERTLEKLPTDAERPVANTTAT